MILTSLSDPAYPPLARQARISGDVEIRIQLRRDGSIQSAVVVGGHAILAEAALSSVRQSQFECRQCLDELTPYSIVYSFQEDASPGWPCPQSPTPRITKVENHVTITVEPSMVYPIFENTRARSIKCLYLWSCGFHWGGEDYYYYRVRSAACLDLWNCGHALREPFATCGKLHRKISY